MKMPELNPSKIDWLLFLWRPIPVEIKANMKARQKKTISRSWLFGATNSMLENIEGTTDIITQCIKQVALAKPPRLSNIIDFMTPLDVYFGL